MVASRAKARQKPPGRAVWIRNGKSEKFFRLFFTRKKFSMKIFPYGKIFKKNLYAEGQALTPHNTPPSIPAQGIAGFPLCRYCRLIIDPFLRLTDTAPPRHLRALSPALPLRALFPSLACLFPTVPNSPRRSFPAQETCPHIDRFQKFLILYFFL